MTRITDQLTIFDNLEFPPFQNIVCFGSFLLQDAMMIIIYEDMTTMTKNIWFVWSKISYIVEIGGDVTDARQRTNNKGR